MALPRLIPGSQYVQIQETAFTHDTIGRYICNRWDEAVSNPRFDVVVIGSGMYGSYCAQRLFHDPSQPRVLVLEAGRFLVPDHLQKLPRLDLSNPDDPTQPARGGESPDGVWQRPYNTSSGAGGLAYCVGGRSLYWGGWCPRLTGDDLARWPEELAAYLPEAYRRFETIAGVEAETAFLRGGLYERLTARLSAGSLRRLEPPLPAPLAMIGEIVGGSRLCAFDKFTSATLLIDAVREDARRAGLDDRTRRLFVVPGARVLRLESGGDPRRVTRIDLVVPGEKVESEFERKEYPVPEGCVVVLALGTIESTRLALDSFPSSPFAQDERMGRNLAAHMRSDVVVSVPLEHLGAAVAPATGAAVPDPAAEPLDAAALLLQGRSRHGSFHLELTAVSGDADGASERLYRMIPDLDLFRLLLKERRPGFATIALRGHAETHGVRDRPVAEQDTSWINLSPFPSDRDEFDRPRAYVQWRAGDRERNLWEDMQEAMADLVRALGGTVEKRFGEEPMETCVHEAGTLWMGRAGESVTDLHGRFHHVENAYCADQALFPTAGSADPVLTGLALADRVCDGVIEQLRQARQSQAATV